MHVGVLVTATAQSGDLAEIAKRVEAEGFDSLWIPEHPIIPVGHQTPFPGARDGKLPEHYNRWADPFIALTVAATVTKKIKLGTGICLIPEREPMVTAKTIASLDLYSGGRVIIGAGAGWLREETIRMAEPQLISNKYEFIRQLGLGGMGVVYQVRHVNLDYIYALKVLPAQLMESPELVTRFRFEAQLMAQLNHPGIVKVIDFDQDTEQGFYYYIMEYIEGKTLGQHLRGKGALALPELLAISRQSAEALAYAHTTGMS